MVETAVLRFSVPCRNFSLPVPALLLLVWIALCLPAADQLVSAIYCLVLRNPVCRSTLCSEFTSPKKHSKSQ